MRKLICFVLICIVLTACNNEQLLIINEPESSAVYDGLLPVEWRSVRLLNCIFHVQWDFDIAVAQAQAYEVPDGGTIISGVIPHHLLAGRMIASFLKTAADNSTDIETVVLIAPVHFAEDVELCTTMSDWAAPFGIMPTDLDFSERFKSVLGAEINDTVIEEDHSAAALIPFIKHYFPNASIAVLLIEANAPHDIPERLAALLAEFAGEKNCLFLFSVDFSHYLMPNETYRRDEESRKAVIDGDLERIGLMTNANMDSPKSIMTFLILNELLNLELHELDYSNSMEIMGIPYPNPIYDEGLTSYFVFGAVKN
jgi:AmmeMemoRadiSam system protein B